MMEYPLRQVRQVKPDVHVWWLQLDLGPTTLGSLEGLLSPEEISRAGRFAFDLHRRRYVAAHGLLRVVLADHLGTTPEKVALESESGGKPRLRGGGPCFNLSHAGPVGLVAVSADHEVGIDVEEIRDIAGLDELAGTCFSPAERAALAAVPAPDRLRAFFTGWTRKEAFLKATGEGFSRPLSSFDVTLAPGEPARLLRVEGRAVFCALRALEPAPGYVGALAVLESQATVYYHTWDALSALLEDSDGTRGVGGHDPVRGRRQPRGAVLDLAGRQGDSQRLARGGQGRAEDGLPRLGEGQLDRHDAAQPASGRRAGGALRALKTAGKSRRPEAARP
jgi:4'-phosphopantetheinyl transferase